MRVIHRGPEAQRRNRSNAWNSSKAATDRIPTDDFDQQTVKLAVPFPQGFTDFQQTMN